MKVWGFGLHVTEVNVLCTGELVLVENVVLGCGAVEPCWALGFDKDAAGGVDVNLGIEVWRLVEVMVGDPGPDVFKVAGRFGREV